jgi:hypothetical protein
MVMSALAEPLVEPSLAHGRQVVVRFQYDSHDDKITVIELVSAE